MPVRNALSDLRQYIKGTLFDEAAAPISFRLPVTTAMPRFGDADIYDTRLSGADLREVRAAERERPVADYEPAIFGYHDPVTGVQEPALGVGARTGDPTSTAAGNADANRWMLERQAPIREYDRVVPREIVRGVAGRLCPDDQQALRGMARIGKTERVQGKHGMRDVTVTVKYLATEANVRRETIHRRQHDAAKALLAGLYEWHEAHPERRIA